LVVGCSTEEIELRPAASVTVASPDPLPSGEDPELPEPVQPRDGTGGAVYEPGVTPPNSDGVSLPISELLPPEGCEKVDFLFVIDNSDSMDEEQLSLTTAFPAFADLLGQVLKPIDSHVMVVSTDGDQEEEDEPTLDVAECDDVRGAGKRRNVDGDDCGILNGLAFMTDQQPDLASTFSCAANVGTGGSAVEKQIAATLEATSAALNAPGRCNAGFLREDAMLVVMLVTDEEDDRSEAEPEDWRRLLLDVKGGREDAVVVLGLVGDNNVEGGLPGGPCSGGDADAAPRLQTFVNSFEERGVLGSVCAPDYTPFLSLTVGWIERACREFVPPVLF
jgi:hypothetical protein